MDFNFKEITKKESSALEIIKIVLLLQVVIGHALALSFPSMNALTNNLGATLFKSVFSFGREAAYLFIFLSGFFTSKIFINEAKTIELFTVIVKRIKRIYPIYLTALLLTIILDYIGFNIYNYSVYFLNGFNCDTTQQFTYYHFIFNLFSLQPVFSETFGSNTPLWTLGYLVQFYIIGVILKKISIIITFNYYYLMLGAMLITSIFNLEFASLFFVWFSGVLIRYFNFRLNKSPKFIFLISCILVIILIQRFSPMYYSIFLTPLLGFFILISISVIPKRVAGLNLLTFPRLPDISYSLYAVHMPILFLIYGFFENLVNMNNLVWQFSYIILSFLICVFCAYIVLKINTASFKFFKWKKILNL